MTWLQVTRCASSDCDFFISSEGVLTRTPTCNAAACSGWLRLDQKNILELGTGVFSNMSGITTLWVFCNMGIFTSKNQSVPSRRTTWKWSLQQYVNRDFLCMELPSSNKLCHLSNDSVDLWGMRVSAAGIFAWINCLRFLQTCSKTWRLFKHCKKCPCQGCEWLSSGMAHSGFEV